MGRSEELLEALGRQRRCLRKEREDAAAIVVDDDDAQVGPAACQGRQGTAVVEEGDVADDGDGRLPSEGDTEGGGHHSVDAVGTPVGVGDRPPAAEPFEVANRHRRGDDEPNAIW